ncbi:hypothetical protein [Phenylobacterium sp.]|jgi:hypothetical protein|nr:hypothetical protein [Phenylobacterium sp.]
MSVSIRDLIEYCIHALREEGVVRHRSAARGFAAAAWLRRT